jgi:hypothetical protein
MFVGFQSFFGKGREIARFLLADAQLGREWPDFLRVLSLLTIVCLAYRGGTAAAPASSLDVQRLFMCCMRTLGVLQQRRDVSVWYREFALRLGC